MVEFEVPIKDVRYELGPQADAFLLQLEEWSISINFYVHLEKGYPLYFARLKYNAVTTDTRGDSSVSLRLLRNAVTLASIVHANEQKEIRHPQEGLTGNRG